jgi:diguanylate cyclase (GGDEF)-like protein/PAS domain S-box-containing protein
MRISIARKVIMSLGAIVLAAILAMAVTHYASTRAVHSTLESHTLGQSLWAAVSDMEVDVVSGGLRLFQYLESGDPYYLDAYRQHRERFTQHLDQRRALAPLAQWQQAVSTVAQQYEDLDRGSQAVIAAHDRMDQKVKSMYDLLPRLVAASSALYEGAAPDSAQFALGKKIESARAALFIALLDFIHRDRGDGSVAARIGAVRPLLAAYARVPLAQDGRTRLAEFERVFESFSANMDEVLQASQVKRDDMTKVLFMQRRLITTIATRVKPGLEENTAAAVRSADQGMMRVRYVTGAIVLLLSLLALLAGRYLWRSIVPPIRQLAAGADAIGGGKLDHRVSLATRDEYADLAKTFNHMIGQLQSTMVSRAAHEEQASQLRTLLDGVQDYAIFSVDVEGYVTHWNVASTRILGHAAEDMEGVSFARIFKDTQHARIARDDGLREIAGSGRYETNTSLMRKNGEVFDANIVVTPLAAAGERLQGYTFVVRDITERIKAERHIEQLATRDTLTGLFNRNMLMEQLTSAIARAARAHTQVAVMFIDLDNFKNVNDTLGHAAGDALLRECAKRLLTCVREVDIVARLGGDEFLVLLTDITEAAAVTQVAERMLKLLASPYHIQGHEAQTSASIGICLFPTDGSDVTTLMKNADIAMYHAKEQNRNNFQFYAEQMNLRMVQRTQLERELRAALDNREFVLHYQPQVDVASGRIRGVESLVRWQHPARGLLAPGHFIAVAEETGLIVPMGEWILDHACLTMKTWRNKGVAVPYVGVNVSAVQLNGGLVDSVREALIRHGIEPGWLMLEITETMLMERVEEAIAILKRIRELGVRIAMDDFGTGYSSLSVLQRLPLDTLKIDRSFVSAVDETSNTPAVVIIGAIVAIAKELNLTVVAEGVETPTQLAFLRTLNCDAYQGYFFSKPVDTMVLETRFTAPAKYPFDDADGRAISMTHIVNLELPTDA